MAKLKKQHRIFGEARERIRAQIARKYARGMSIRELAEETGRSYGFIHRLLRESDVQMRPRGGNTRLLVQLYMKGQRTAPGGRVE